MINDLGTQSSEVQIIFGELHIDTENSATGRIVKQKTTPKIDKLQNKIPPAKYFENLLLLYLIK